MADKDGYLHCIEDPESVEASQFVLRWLADGVPPHKVMSWLVALYVGTGVALGVPLETLQSIAGTYHRQFTTEAPTRVMPVDLEESNEKKTVHLSKGPT